jgi:hypothetical protein
LDDGDGYKANDDVQEIKDEEERIKKKMEKQLSDEGKN